jgi:hypothetical protein
MSIPADQKLYDKIKERVKARVARWPSAYASGQVVQEYKAAMEKKGKMPYVTAKPSEPKKQTPLGRWYAEKWIDIKTGKPCGAVKTADYYPTCRPAKRITAKTPTTAKELTPSQKTAMIAQKQKAKKQTVHYKQTQKKGGDKTIHGELWDAAIDGDLKKITALLDKGADANAYNGKVLQSAVMNCHLEAVKILINKGADIHKVTEFELCVATEKGGLYTIVEYLQNQGLNIDKATYEKLRICEWRAKNPNQALTHSIIRFFIDTGRLNKLIN